MATGKRKRTGPCLLKMPAKPAKSASNATLQRYLDRRDKVIKENKKRKDEWEKKNKPRKELLKKVFDE
jgi:hypothetical protein